jgi:WhiB family redox-sensing transcriptional regulator
MAKAVCAGCVVREECREFAYAGNEQVGIWGGETERTRRQARRERLAERRAMFAWLGLSPARSQSGRKPQ